MKQTASILLIAMAACAAIARSVDFVMVEGGVIRPPGAVASVQELAEVAASNIATAVRAQVLQETTAAVSNLVGEVRAVVDSLEGVMYWNGYTLDYGVAEAVDEPYESRIVGFVPGVATNATHVMSDVYAHFTVAPEELPTVRFATSLTREGDWDEAAIVEVVEDEWLVGATLYECYRIRVAVPVEYQTAYFRVFSAPQTSQAGAYLPVSNGISPNGLEPLTGTFTVDGQTIRFEGGIRVLPAE